MNTFLSNGARPFTKLTRICITSLITISLLFACSSNKNIKQVRAFRVVEATLAKGIEDVDNQDVLLTPTKSFTTGDNAVFAHVRFANISGKHNVQWKWYGPDGYLYYATDKYPIGTAKGKYAEEATTWHKISIKDDKAEQYPGEWKVAIYLDGELIASNKFDISIDTQNIEYNVDTDIPISAIKNPDGIAVVIGNRSYQHHDIPSVDYAHNDAETVKLYLINTLGYKEGNIFLEKDITKARFETLFGIRDNHRGILHDYVKPGQSDIFIYYSGHGSLDLNQKKGYFVPADCDPSKISLNGYALDLFYENLSKMDARKVTVVLDSCFSGITNSGRYLSGSASPALIKIDTANINKGDIALLTSSDSHQISSWYDEKGHGLFTYFFLQGIAGAADQNNNGQITFQEIYNYVSDRSEGVPYWARRLHGGRDQTPMLYGNRNQDVLVQF
jgi:hypothetical protein